MAEVTNVPAESTITVKQGTSFDINLAFDKGVAVPLDLTPFEVRATVRYKYGDPVKLVYATSAATGAGALKITIDDAPGGLAIWSLIPEDTTPILYPNLDDDSIDLVFDIELHKSTGDVVYSPIRGTFTLIREVTYT